MRILLQINNYGLMNLDNLFPSNNNSGGTNKKLDVDSLFSASTLITNNQPKITFTSQNLIDRNKKREDRKLCVYKKLLNFCFKRIDSADDDGFIDLIFEIPEFNSECKGYNSHECLIYIQSELNKQNIDNVIISVNKMYISWKSLIIDEKIKHQPK